MMMMLLFGVGGRKEEEGMRRLWKETMKEVEEPVLSRYGNFIRGFPLLLVDRRSSSFI
jgi:hypothetical protein